MDIILFAILAGFLFFRLWNILGTRTGHEKQRFDIFESSADITHTDKIILLPRKKEEPPLQSSMTHDVDEKLSNIQAIEKKFNSQSFLNGAVIIFSRIITSFANGDVEDLKKFLSKDVFKKFEKSIKERFKNKQKRIAEVENVQAQIIDVDIDKKKYATIQVRFSSHQMVVTIEPDGQSFDNPARLKVPMIDIWTFSRQLGDEDPTWFLTATKTEPA